MSISRTFASWASGLSYAALPDEVVDKVKALLLVHLVAGVIGAENPHAQHLTALVKTEEGKADGATILGDGAKATRNGATLANAETMHVAGLFDCFRMLTHPGPSLVAAALTNAELEHKSVNEMITALAAGYEFTCRLADDFVPATSAHGFRPAPIFATLGAAMVAGKLFDLDEDGLVAAIAVAANCASGLNESARTPAGLSAFGRAGGGEAAVHEPNAARQGVYAATMARLGQFSGSEEVIEGDAGFFAAYAGSREGRLSYSFSGQRKIDLASITEGLGEEYKLLHVMFRFYAAGAYNQPVIDLMAELRQQHHLDADEIDKVVISMNYLETLYPSPEFPRIADNTVASVGSIQYFAAHAAVNGGYPVVGGRTFGPTGGDLAHDERVLEFMKHHVELNGVYGYPLFSPRISVTTKSGATFHGEYPYSRLEWDFQQLVERLQSCVPGLPGGQQRLDDLVETVGGIDASTSLREIFRATGTI